jgi:hypothetical protein
MAEGQPPRSLDEPQRNFHLEEYKQLRAEVTVLLARVEQLFRYSLIVTATIYAWLITQSVGIAESRTVCLKLPYSLIIDAWKIPPAFVFLSGMIGFVTYWRIRQIGQYLNKLEIDLGHTELGWERFLKPKAPILTTSTVAAWILMFAAAIYGTQTGMKNMNGNSPACKSEVQKTL